MNKIRYAISTGFDVSFYRDKGHRNYGPTVTSFSRYVRTMKALGWKERLAGLCVSIREPA